MPHKILAVVDDLFFLAKIQQTARQLEVAVEPMAPDAVKDRLSGSEGCAVLLDLNHRSGAALEVIETIKGNPLTEKVPVVGFLPHVQGELAHAARNAGCDQVLARSAFSAQLPLLLKQLLGQEASEPPKR